MRILLCQVGLLVTLAGSAFAQNVRIATFNVKELGWRKIAQVDEAGHGANAQLRAAAEVLQRVRPDVVLINEIDYTGPVDADGDPPADKHAARAFHDRYLAVSQNGLNPLKYEHLFYRATNTGMPAGVDFNNNGRADDPNDAFGFGRYPGEYGMALFSRFPLDAERARTFRKLLWRDVPDNLLPDGTGGKPAFYTPASVAAFRLSSKSHWDVLVTISGRTIHLLCSHPTPPVFDGPEDAHGRRNFDELRFWRDYLAVEKSVPDAQKRPGHWIRDDAGVTGGLSGDQSFVILGDLNADRVRGDTVNGLRPIELVLDHPRVFDPRPQSAGAMTDSYPERYAAGRPFRTSDFGRLDYALPSRDLKVSGSGVYWPDVGEPGHDAARRAGDHRLVWVDIAP
jgi:hypothetical protein